jgi:hypothetical protein
MRIIRSQVQYISSYDRQEDEQINNFVVMYPQNFMRVEAGQSVSMSLTSFECYNYFFWTNRYNNAFNVIFGGIEYLLFLPIGFYSVAENMANFIILLATLGITATASPYTDPIFGTLTGQYVITTDKPFTLNFNGRPGENNPMNASLLLGFNIGGNYAFNTDLSTTTPVGYSFDILSDQDNLTPAPPIEGKLRSVFLHLNVPRQNVAYNVKTRYVDYTSAFAQIPIGDVPPYDPVLYNPQDINTWTWQSPASGQKLGSIRYKLLTSFGSEMPMVANYTMAIRIDIMEDDVADMIRLMRESLKMQKLLLIGQSHQMPPEEQQQEEDVPDETQQEVAPDDGVPNARMTEDQLHEGTLDYYGNNLYYD